MIHTPKTSLGGNAFIHQLFPQDSEQPHFGLTILRSNQHFVLKMPYTSTPLTVRTHISTQNKIQPYHSIRTTPTKYSFVNFSAFGKRNACKGSIHKHILKN